MPADPIGTLAGEQIVKKKPKVSQPPLKVTSRSRLLLALGCVTLLAALVYSTNLGSIQKIDFQEVERKEDYLRKIPIDAGPTETISEAQKILPKEDGTQSAVNLEAIESSSSTTIETSTSSHLQTNTPTATEIDTPSVVEDIVEEAKRRHGNSFGGINNVGSPGGAKAAANEDGVAFADIIIPVSNVGHATPSLNRANLVNLWGHYFHDEHYSPYASHLYKGKPKEELDTEQEKYIEKMKRVRKEWGAWDFQDPDPNKERKAANFNTPYKDLKVSNFPESSWQADKDYNILFLKESKALVKRMQHAIYAEYGWPLTDDMSAEDLDKHEKAWKIQVIEATDPGHPKGHWAGSMTDGIASLTKSAMDGLVRKLLHAMMTHDDFYAVLAGHSAAAGHGNNFQQNRILTFQQIMEPVFDKLGMRLISRNMAMGGVGTLQFSFAGGDLYGEADIIEWDSGMTENGVSVDFFNKQAILSGERVPVLITEKPFQILVETDGMAYLGRYINDKPIFPETTLENVQTLPYAAQWHDEKEDKYNAICWEPRSDFEPTLSQKDKPDSQLGWHPGNRRHTWSGRKLALIVLHGLSIALDVWEGGIQDAGVPLAEKYWHVRAEYESIREKLRTHVTTPQPDNADVRSPCEKMIPWLPRVCRVQMHGYGMWVPRAHADFDFLKLVHPAPNGYKPYYSQKNIYDGFDLLPYRQKLADSEIDVHAVAIATTDPAPELNHYWIEDEKIEIKTENATSPPTRQLLERASERATEQISIGKGKRRKSAKVHPVTSEIRTKNNRSHRNLDAADDIVPGRGWEVHGWDAEDAFCDGSAQSECSRTAGNNCLLYGANDKHMGLLGSSLSGWLVFTVPNVKEGIILIRMEWWCNMAPLQKMTDGWTEVNDGKTMDTIAWNTTEKADGRRRNLGKQDLDPPEGRGLKATFEQTVPVDLEMDIAINGSITKTMKYEEWKTFSAEASKNCAVWPILNDITIAEKEGDGELVEVAVRFRSNEKPNLGYCISHVYYA